MMMITMIIMKIIAISTDNDNNYIINDKLHNDNGGVIDDKNDNDHNDDQDQTKSQRVLPFRNRSMWNDFRCPIGKEFVTGAHKYWKFEIRLLKAISAAEANYFALSKMHIGKLHNDFDFSP